MRHGLARCNRLEFLIGDALRHRFTDHSCNAGELPLACFLSPTSFRALRQTRVPLL